MSKQQYKNAQDCVGARNGGSVQDDQIGQNPRSPHERHKEAIKRAKALAPKLKATHEYTGRNRKERAQDQLAANGIDSSTGPICGDTEAFPKPSDGQLSPR